MSMRYPFIESERETRGIGAGPDFPGSSGDRERGKFRPSQTPGLTRVAVSGDDGQPLVKSTDQLLEELITVNRGILLALSLTAMGAEFTVDDVLAAVS